MRRPPAKGKSPEKGRRKLAFQPTMMHVVAAQIIAGHTGSRGEALTLAAEEVGKDESTIYRWLKQKWFQRLMTAYEDEVRESLTAMGIGRELGSRASRTEELSGLYRRARAREAECEERALLATEAGESESARSWYAQASTWAKEARATLDQIAVECQQRGMKVEFGGMDDAQLLAVLGAVTDDDEEPV